MSRMREVTEKRGVRLKLPGTSANLGPGFDAAGLAMSMHLSVEAQLAPVWQIHATGCNAELCGALEGNLIVDTFRSVMERAGFDVPALKLTIHNEIPLGMGCGSSPAALCAGVALADRPSKEKAASAASFDNDFIACPRRRRWRTRRLFLFVWRVQVQAALRRAPRSVSMMRSM